mmetsp:Transcript_87110/g.154148  ORF Transcript_87110/g.154148 Transcript_87110/m.154148 type:complete len:546 (-) Transcript_87110:131-1768(-)
MAARLAVSGVRLAAAPLIVQRHAHVLHPSCRTLASSARQPPTQASETALGLLRQIQGATDGEGSVLSSSAGLLRLSLPGSVSVGQVVDVGGIKAVVLRFDRRGVIAARLASGSDPVHGEAARPISGGMLTVRMPNLPTGGLSFACLQNLTEVGASEAVLRLPAPPAPPQRQQVRHRLPSGLAAPEVLLPLGEGQRVGLVGSPGTGKSTALRMMAASQAADTAVVFVALQQQARLQSKLEAAGLRDRSSASPTIVLHADPAMSPPAERYLLFLCALRLALKLKASHRHVLLAVDDLTGFAEAAADLGGAQPFSASQAVASLLDAGGNVRIGSQEQSLSVAAVMDLSPEDELATTPRDLWRSAEQSLDVCLNFRRDLAVQGLFPAISADDLFTAGGYAPCYQAPMMKALRDELRSLIRRSRELKDRLEIGKQLGFQAELEDLDNFGSDNVARALLGHSVPRGPRELAVLVCASVVLYFPHQRPPPRSVVASFQAGMLNSIKAGHPVLWEALGSLSDMNDNEASAVLRELGEAILARRYEFQLTQPEL